MKLRRFACLSLVVVLALHEPARAGLLGSASHSHKHVQPPQILYIPCYTLYKAGEESNDLQVHLRGTSYNVLEIFFKENVVRYTIPHGINLCTHGRVLMAQKNTFGTFAVQYGWSGFTAFGWKGDELVPLTVGQNVYPPTGSDPTPHIVQINIDPRFAVRLEWVTTRILRIVHGPDCSMEYLLRFDGDAKPWKLLYEGPVGTQ